MQWLRVDAILWVGVCCLVGTDAAAEFTVERVLDGLNQPIHMAQAPGDNNTLYVVERASSGSEVGRIVSYDQLTGERQTFLDVEGTVVNDGGLLSVTFHPEYATNGKFYTVSNSAGTNGLDEWQVTAGEPVLQRRLLEYQNLSNVFHTMNVSMFRPGGNNNELFVVTGDGGTQANQGTFNPALIESLDSPYGKLLRIDLDEPFATPANGPTDAGVDVVARGLRNPYRATFDRQTGDMFIGDVGFNAVEEVNFIPASHFSNASAPLHFGWTDREGTIQTVSSNPNAGGPKEPGDIDPIYEYARNAGVPLGHASDLYGGSITGGYVYRGPVEELQGRYYFADFTAGRVHSGVFDRDTPVANYNGQNFTDVHRHDVDYENMVPGGSTITWVTSFGEDNVGNLYIVKFGNAFFPPLGEGEVFRIANNPLDVVVDRQTGVITLANNNSSDVSISKLAIRSAIGAVGTSTLTTISGNYDANGNMQVSGDAWQVSTTSASLFIEETTGGMGTLDSGSTLALSTNGGWIPTPHEDLRVAVELADGSISTAIVTYVGDPLIEGDFDFDGILTRADFGILANFAYTDFSGLSLPEAYGRGDINGDGVNDFADFVRFKALYIASHGEAAFRELAQVPEPSSLLVLVSVVTVARVCAGSRGWRAGVQ
ncbi:PQQ-dependent sugar dehydrogenase [Aeoliella sp. SH292]|uniref:PQQ-dependent sugar dehydrogenase n=1 Tax=Aeoliella sp. SH292 TaxID=3454464 RepID=UPI003F9B06BB